MNVMLILFLSTLHSTTEKLPAKSRRGLSWKLWVVPLPLGQKFYAALLAERLTESVIKRFDRSAISIISAACV